MTNAELIKALRICANQTCCDNCPRYDIDHTQDAQRCCIELINDAADALEADEKRIADLEAQIPKEGEWIMDGMNEYELSYGCVGYEPRYRCSKCGITTESYLRTERPIMPEDADFPNYCPNCGARMTKGEDK